MARVKITEYRAKTILFQALQKSYTGLSLSDEKLPKLASDKEYVVKVDEGVKKRMKKGLIKLNVTKNGLGEAVKDLQKKGYSRFIIEEMVPHKDSEEKFLSLERTREGIVIYYSNKGGIDIEENISELKKDILTEKSIPTIASFLTVPTAVITAIQKLFDEYYVSFLEINPLVVIGNNYHILDMAVEVDSTALFFTKNIWRDEDIVSGDVRPRTPEELAVKELSGKSQAAFSLEVLNPNGSIFMLLSGGGASVTLADEAYNLGFGKQIANYGEYSGNPNAEETYLYTKQIISLLKKSRAKKKVLIIGGGVANFTDIRVTFKGVLQALTEERESLTKMKVKIFVRRGGPYQEEGLQMMEAFLKKEGLYGQVSGPELPLNEIIRLGIKNIS